MLPSGHQPWLTFWICWPKVTADCSVIPSGAACGGALCGGAVAAAGACGAEANLGAQAIGACALQIGLCGAVACIALPIGGNW